MAVCVNELWSRLALEGNFKLLHTLQRAERREDGYGTIVVKKEGFSEDDETHNMVLDFLEQIGVHIFNPGIEITKLQAALRNYEGQV